MGNEVTADLVALERRRTAATVAVDIAALEAIYADDLVYVHSTGKRDDKRALLAQLRDMRHIAGMDRGDLDVVELGDAAVMSGPIHYRFRRPDGSERELSAFATQTFSRREGVWQVVSFQATPTSPA